MSIQTHSTDDSALPDAVLNTFESLLALKRHNAINEYERAQLRDLIKQYPELAPLTLLDDYMVRVSDLEALPALYAALQPEAQAASEKNFMEKIHAIRLAETGAIQTAHNTEPAPSPATVSKPHAKPQSSNVGNWFAKTKNALKGLGSLGFNGGWQLVPTFAAGALVGVLAIKALPIETNAPITRRVTTIQASTDIRIAVDSTVSMAMVQRTLLSVKAQIVAGPDSMGFITLRLASADAAAAMAALKLQPWVTSVTDIQTTPNVAQ